nr:MAG TPA: hypothetical protein [Caudoviricetes sp.]
MAVNYPNSVARKQRFSLFGVDRPNLKLLR